MIYYYMFGKFFESYWFINFLIILNNNKKILYFLNHVSSIMKLKEIQPFAARAHRVMLNCIVASQDINSATAATSLQLQTVCLLFSSVQNPGQVNIRLLNIHSCCPCADEERGTTAHSAQRPIDDTLGKTHNLCCKQLSCSVPPSIVPVTVLSAYFRVVCHIICCYI